jgi:uncharacterized Zn finger protein
VRAWLRDALAGLLLFLGFGCPPPQQTCWTWCPWCHTELTAWGDVLTDRETVVYRCPGCGALTVWDFDAPVPLYLRTLGRSEAIDVRIHRLLRS